MSSKYPVKRHTCGNKYRWLKKYFSAYTTVVSCHFSSFYYIDAFAATGKCKEESNRVVDGSPLIALKLKFPFTNYIFIEIRKERIIELEKSIKSHRGIKALSHRVEKRDLEKGVDIQTVNADINEYIDELLNEIPANIPALIFLDPEGLELKWSTVEKCSRKPKVELLINCSISGIVRNLNNPRADKTIKSFLGEPIISSKPMGILHQYLYKLKKHFKYVIPKPVKTRTGTTIYYLIFATNSKIGNKIMSSVMSVSGEQTKLFEE